jgi:hypothetical protein
MLGFKIGDEFLLLRPDTKIMFVLENPFFDVENIILSPHTYNFTVPDDEGGRNRKLLNYIDSISNHQPEHTTQCWVMLNNNQWMFGDLVTEYKNGAFDCYWNQYQNLISNDLEEKLNVVDTGVVIAKNEDDIYNGVRERVFDNYSGIKDFVHYPVYDPDFFDNADNISFAFPPTGGYMHPLDINIPLNFCRYLNYWNSDSMEPGFEDGQFYFPITSTNGPPVHPDEPVNLYLAMSPAIYVKFMLEKMFAYLHFIINTSDFLEDDDIQKLTIWTNKYWYLYETNEMTGIPYTYLIDTFINDDNTADFDLNYFIPEFTIKHFLEGLKKTFCLSFFWNFSKQRISIRSNKNIIESHDGIDWSSKLIVGTEVIRNTEDGFLLQTYYSDDELLTRPKSILGKTLITEVAHYADLVLPFALALDTTCLVTESQYFYKVGKNAVTNNKEWQFYGDNYLEFKIDNGKSLIENPADTLLRKFDVRRPDYDTQSEAKWTIPESFENNDSAAEGVVKKDENLRLLFYRGIYKYNSFVPVGEGTPSLIEPSYPYATHTDMDPLGNVIVGAYSLAWDVANGLYYKWWKKYLDFRKYGRPYVKQVELNDNDLLTFDYEKSIFLTEKGCSTREYLFKTIRIAIGVNDIGVAEVELYPK